MPGSSMVVREAAQPLFLKTKLCRFFQAGKCRRGRDCQYAHEEAELRPLPDFSRTRLCPYLRDQGHCPMGPSCSFAHAAEELRARTPEHAKILEDYKALLAVPAAPAPPPTLLCPPPQFPVCGKKCCVDDDDEDLDLPASSWSRQSTQEPADEVADFASEFSSEEEWEGLEEADVAAAVAADAADVASVETVVKVAEGLNEGLLAYASALGLSLSMKNSFLDVDDVDDGEMPEAQIRRTRSMGDLLAAC